MLLLLLICQNKSFKLLCVSFSKRKVAANIGAKNPCRTYWELNCAKYFNDSSHCWKYKREKWDHSLPHNFKSKLYNGINNITIVSINNILLELKNQNISIVQKQSLLQNCDTKQSLKNLNDLWKYIFVSVFTID